MQKKRNMQKKHYSTLLIVMLSAALNFFRFSQEKNSQSNNNIFGVLTICYDNRFDSMSLKIQFKYVLIERLSQTVRHKKIWARPHLRSIMFLAHVNQPF